MVGQDQLVAIDQHLLQKLYLIRLEYFLEVPEKEVASVEAEVSKLMQNAASLKVPLEVESGIANNWGEAH